MRLIDADVMIEYLRKQLCDNCHEQKDWCGSDFEVFAR